MYKYIHTCIYIHISCLHTYTQTHIYTHVYTYERMQSMSEMMARQRLRGKTNLTPRCSVLLPVCWNPEGDTLVVSSPIARNEERRISAEQPQPTVVPTARRPDHIRLSALVRSQSTQFTQAPSLAARPWPPETRSFSAILAGFFLRSNLLSVIKEVTPYFFK